MQPRQLLVILVGRKGQGKTTALRSILRQRPGAILVDPAGELGGSGGLGVEGAIEAAETINTAPQGALVLLDDADGFMRASSSGGVFKTTMAYARNLDVSIVAAVKNPADVPPWLAGNADVIAHGQFRGRTHLEWARALGLSLAPVHEGELLVERMDQVSLADGALQSATVKADDFGPWLRREGLLP